MGMLFSYVAQCMYIVCASYPQIFLTAKHGKPVKLYND